MPSTYAWIVETDHIAELLPDGTWLSESVCVMGPSDAPDDLVEKLKSSGTAGERFKMYDDDGELYYTGRIIGEFEGYEPLADYGGPNAGAVLIKFPNRPELESEW